MTRDEYLLPLSEALAEAASHARQAYPAESCGIISGGAYIACESQALPADQHRDDADCECQLCSFKIADEIYMAHEGKIQMIAHSHPNGPLYPSKADMQSQLVTGVAWAIIALDEDRIGEPLIWGGDCPVSPLIGREFMHGVWDCYSLIRDVFLAGKEGLEAQGIEGWPYASVALPEYPRNDEWWEHDDDDFYAEKPAQIGFEEISRDDARPGDVFLCAVRSGKLNHGGVMVSQDLILHHLPNRLSRREPAGIWAHSAEKWIRLKDAPHA